jgi:hypothetical protein
MHVSKVRSAAKREHASIAARNDLEQGGRDQSVVTAQSGRLFENKPKGTDVGPKCLYLTAL